MKIVVNKMQNAAAVLNGVPFEKKNGFMVSAVPVDGDTLKLFENIPEIEFMDPPNVGRGQQVKEEEKLPPPPADPVIPAGTADGQPSEQPAGDAGQAAEQLEQKPAATEAAKPASKPAKGKTK